MTCDAAGPPAHPTPLPGMSPPADPPGNPGARGAESGTGRRLAREQATPCRADSPRLRGSEIAALATEVPEWRVTEGDGVGRLERTFAMPSYLAGLDFARRVGLLAEAADHHPAILIEYGRVTVRWWTLAVRGLHRNDFVMAARTDLLSDEWEWDGA